MIYRNTQQSGFTLIETLVAILILTLAIAGGFSTISNGLRSAYLAKNQVTAFYLAQDAFEHIRYIRDSYELESIEPGDNGWDYFLVFILKCSKGSPCIIDTTNNFFDDFGIINGNQNLQYDNNTYRYSHESGINSIFNRTFYVEELKNHELAVIVNVSWKETALVTGSNKSLIIQTVLTDWH